MHTQNSATFATAVDAVKAAGGLYQTGLFVVHKGSKMNWTTFATAVDAGGGLYGLLTGEVPFWVQTTLPYPDESCQVRTRSALLFGFAGFLLSQVKPCVWVWLSLIATRN
jgi:hypothetical protein